MFCVCQLCAKFDGANCCKLCFSTSVVVLTSMNLTLKIRQTKGNSIYTSKSEVLEYNFCLINVFNFVHFYIYVIDVWRVNRNRTFKCFTFMQQILL